MTAKTKAFWNKVGYYTLCVLSLGITVLIKYICTKIEEKKAELAKKEAKIEKSSKKSSKK